MLLDSTTILVLKTHLYTFLTHSTLGLSLILYTLSFFFFFSINCFHSFTMPRRKKANTNSSANLSNRNPEDKYSQYQRYSDLTFADLLYGRISKSPSNFSPQSTASSSSAAAGLSVGKRDKRNTQLNTNYADPLSEPSIRPPHCSDVRMNRAHQSIGTLYSPVSTPLHTSTSFTGTYFSNLGRNNNERQSGNNIFSPFATPESDVGSLTSFKTATNTATPNLLQAQYRRVSVDLRNGTRSLSQETVIFTPTAERHTTVIEGECRLPTRPLFPQTTRDTPTGFQRSNAFQRNTGSVSRRRHRLYFSNFASYTPLVSERFSYQGGPSASVLTESEYETAGNSLASTPTQATYRSARSDYTNEPEPNITQLNQTETAAIKSDFTSLKQNYIQLENDFNLLLAQYIRLMDMTSHSTGSETSVNTLFEPQTSPQYIHSVALPATPFTERRPVDGNNSETPYRKVITRPDTPDLESPSAMITTIEDRTNIRIQPHAKGNSLKKRCDLIYPIYQRMDPRKRLLISKSRAYRPWGFKPDHIMKCSQQRGNLRIPTKEYKYNLKSTSTNCVAKRFKEQRLRWALRKQNRNASKYSVVDMPRSKHLAVALWRRIRLATMRVLFPRYRLNKV